MIDKIGRKISWEIENIEELDVRRERERETAVYSKDRQRKKVIQSRGKSGEERERDCDTLQRQRKKVIH